MAHNLPDLYLRAFFHALCDILFLTEPVDMREVINQTVMEVLFKIKDSDTNPVLNLKPISPDVSPMKQYGSSPTGYV